MEYLKINVSKPLHYVSGGLFVTDEPWKHEKRTIDSYEMIIGVNEVLYIQQDGIQYNVKPGEVLILIPHISHSGCRICNKHVSFYWFHFLCPSLKVSDELDEDTIINIRTNPETSHIMNDIYFPKYASPIAIQRLNILANQLIDVDNSNYYTRMSMNYLLTSMLIELSEQTLSPHHASSDLSQDRDMNLNQILEWSRINAFEGISLSDVAEKFSYNKDYLSRFFKKKTGKTLQSYLHKLRITKAKDLLVGTRSPIKVISNRVGIEDEKYFMRLFKKYEKMTPTEYRKAYAKTHLNRK
ncbi:AraC family transcriptional regulator [Gracilibacillus sp. YIM 98692]|uniref:helix-turn-helix domain-containing protein n=1 Tax=Gracilibacillus sp. YIM 98692 TaxID=2663532 RepID=UPI0013D3382F|nr:AraC family transcriptional regulator [Gracilibacillus sp. YIM 98692]